MEEIKICLIAEYYGQELADWYWRNPTSRHIRLHSGTKAGLLIMARSLIVLKLIAVFIKYRDVPFIGTGRRWYPQISNSRLNYGVE
jgi:hypothetical protein